MSEPVTLLEMLQAIADEAFERWDKDMRAGKLLTALSGRIANYDPRVTAIRNALAGHAANLARIAELEATTKWQDISTAEHTPKSRLVWCPDRKNIYVVTWFDDDRGMGWRHFGSGHSPLTEEPTHWMPLPSPPAPASVEEQAA